jgi:hypothetical protein
MSVLLDALGSPPRDSQRDIARCRSYNVGITRDSRGYSSSKRVLVNPTMHITQREEPWRVIIDVMSARAGLMIGSCASGNGRVHVAVVGGA